MLAYNRLLTSGRLDWESINIETGAVVTSSQTGTPIMRRFSTGAPIVRGDHIKPNPHSYMAYTSKFYKGISQNERIVYPRSRFTYRGDTGTEPSSIIAYGPDEATVYNMAVAKFYDKLRGDIDLSIEVAQMSQTLRMLKLLKPQELVKRVKTLSESLRKDRYGVLKAPADIWLEFIYGWRPFVSTVYDCVEQWVGGVDSLAQKRVRASVAIPYPQSLYIVLDYPPDKQKLQVHGRVACSIKASVSRPTQAQVIASWTSLNPASIAWEILPYSFVVDWFLNVGAYLRSVESDYLYRGSLRDIYVSQLNAYEYGTQFDYLARTSADVTFKSYSASRKQVKFSRSLATTLSPRKPRIVLGSLCTTRMLSAASLLAQFLPRK